jgi:hypothetical protein
VAAGVSLGAEVGSGVLVGSTVGAVVASGMGVSIGATGVSDGGTVGAVVAAAGGVLVGAAATVIVACGDGTLVAGATTVSVGATTGVAVGGCVLGSAAVAFAGSFDVAVGARPCDEEGGLTAVTKGSTTVPSAAARVVVAARLSAVCVAPILSSSILTLFGK